MRDSSANTAPWLGESARFATTRWTVVLRAGHDGPDRPAALECLCRDYWYPVYAFVRKRGSTPDDARDLTQEFFFRLIEKNWLTGVEQRETRFSTLLLTMLKRFLINEDEKRCTLKRGGGVPLLSIDLARAEQFFGAEPTTDESPDRIFERRWALAILAAALERLREEVAAAGKARHFEILEPFLSREPEPMEYFKAGMELKIPQRSVAVAVHRLRQHYREMLRGELSLGATRRGEVEEELRALSQALTECA